MKEGVGAHHATMNQEHSHISLQEKEMSQAKSPKGTDPCGQQRWPWLAKSQGLCAPEGWAGNKKALGRLCRAARALPPAFRLHQPCFVDPTLCPGGLPLVHLAKPINSRHM